MMGDSIRDRIIADYASGEKYAYIEERHGVSSNLIVRIAREAGLVIRGPYRSTSTLVASFSDILRAYDDGEPVASIARRYNCTPQHIRYIARRHSRPARLPFGRKH